MFLFRGGQAVEKGTYWEPDAGKKIVVKENGFLPGDRRKGYFKLPKSYFLISILLLGLGLSMAFPYGIGVAAFALLYVLYKILFFLGSTCKKLLGAGEKAKLSRKSERNVKEKEG